MAVSFDLFGTLLEVERPADPAAAVADALADRGVAIPPDWERAYRESHVDAPDGAEISLPVHVRAALSSRDVTAAPAVVHDAVLAAFDVPVSTRQGAPTAVAAASGRGPVAICSNCAVPGLVGRALARSGLRASEFDAVVSSVDCGWRKPHPEIFRATAAELGVEPATLLHVGDDPRTDGGVERVGGEAILLEDVPLAALPAHLEAIDR